ncbi:MAG: TIR domain-containing protein [Ginsengibacter sp.]
MNDSTNTGDVYISYAGNDANDDYANSRDEIVKKICSLLEQKNLRAREYKRDVQYKDGLDDYMLDIAYAEFIIILISEKYLRSEYCMYEAIELLSINKRGLKEKIFPVVLPDAKIFDDNKHIEYIDYWDKMYTDLDEKLKGKDAKKYMSLYSKGIRYREISENMDEFLMELNKMCQLSKGLIIENNYQVVVDSIVNQLELNRKAPIPVQAAAANESSSGTTLYPQILNNSGPQNVAALSKSANDFMSLVMNKVDDVILDSEKAKKDFININFEEISGDGEILPATLNFIFKLRTDKTKYESYRQSLIISALSLGLIKKYDETKARLLIDFATDDDPVLSYRALTGVVIGLLDKENFISEDLQRKLDTLRDNVKIQRCLLVIFFFVGNTQELRKIANSLQNIDYNKFEFFNQAQHWFQPFYEGNPILKENVSDKKFAKGLLESIIFLGLDSTKYALALLFPTLTQENIDEFKKFQEIDGTFTNFISTDYLKAKFLLEIEVSKYVLEFYIYALTLNDNYLISLIEDKKELRAGYLYRLVLNDTYQYLLKANQHFIKKEYKEAAQAILPVLDDQPNNIEALLMYGHSSYFAGNFAEVIPSFQKVLAKGITEIQVLAFLGDSYFNTKEFEKAIPKYEQLLTLQNNTAANINIGRSYQLKENPEPGKALEYYLKAFEQEPGNYYNLLLLGDCYANLNPSDYAHAFEYYEKAFSIDDKNINLLNALTSATINLPGLEFEICEKIYARHIELEPQNTLPYIAWGDRYQGKEPKDYVTAIEYYDRAFEIDNSNINLIKAYANCLVNLPKAPMEKAVKLFTKWIELEPKNTYPYLALGDCYMRLDLPDYKNAFEYYFKGFNIDDSNLDIIKFLDDFLYKTNEIEFEKANRIYKKFIELDPQNQSGYNGMAHVYTSAKPPNYKQAFEYYYKAFDIKNTGPLIEVLLTCAAKLKDHGDEIPEALYSKYKEMEQNSVKPAFAMARYYEEKVQPDFEKANDYYVKALEINSSDKELLSSIGKFYQIIPEPDYIKSFQYLNEAIKLDPDDTFVNFYLGWGNFVSGNYDAAKTYFENCKPGVIDDKAVYQNLGHIALIQKDAESAKKLYKKSFDLFGDREEFYNSSISDFKFMQKAGISREEFDLILKEISNVNEG